MELNFLLQKTCSCRGNTVRLSDSHTYNNMGISVAKGSNIRVSYNNLPAETDMGFMQSEQRLHRKSAGFTEIQSPDL